MVCQPSFLWDENGKKKAVLKFIGVLFSPSEMFIPNLRASISKKLIYPANRHVEQQIAFLPKWIECIQSNHHPAKGVQINLVWLLFFFTHCPPTPCPQEHPFYFDLLLFLTLKWNFGICPENSGKIFMFLFLCKYPNWRWETLSSSLSWGYSDHSLWHVWQKLWEGWLLPKTIFINCSIFIELHSRHKVLPRASGVIKDTGMSLLMTDS